MRLFFSKSGKKFYEVHLLKLQRGTNPKRALSFARKKTKTSRAIYITENLRHRASLHPRISLGTVSRRREGMRLEKKNKQYFLRNKQYATVRLSTYEMIFTRTHFFLARDVARVSITRRCVVVRLFLW